MIAQNTPQGRMQQVGSRMIQGNAPAVLFIDPGQHTVTHLQSTSGHPSQMAKDGAPLLAGVRDLEAGITAWHQEFSPVPHLAAGFGIKGGLVQHHHALSTGFQAVHGFTVMKQANDGGLFLQPFIAGEIGLAIQGNPSLLRHAELAGGPGPGALGVHLPVEAGCIDLQTTLPGDVCCQIRRKTIGIVKLEHQLPRNDLSGKPADGFFENLHTLLDGFSKALFFHPQHPLDRLPGLDQLRIGITHLLAQGIHQLVEERLFLPQLVAMTNGAPDDAAQDIASSLIGRRHPINDQESAGTDVICNHPQGFALQIRGAGHFCRSTNQRLEQVDLVVGMHALHNGCQAFQTHARIHRRLGQRRHVAFCIPVVLHEHQIPDLDIAVAIFLRSSRGSAFDFFTMVIENLGTRATGAGIAHAPEIVALVGFATGLVTNATETRGIHADFLEPDVCGLVVLVIDRDPKLFRRQTHHLREKFPGELDGLTLEVVTKAEITQHLEESVMSGGVTDILQVVVLTPGTYAALRGSRARIVAFFLAQEQILELHHPGIGKQEGRIIGRHQGTGLHDGVSLAGKIIEECLSDFSAGFHVWPLDEYKAVNVMQSGAKCHPEIAGKLRNINEIRGRRTMS